MEIQTQIIKFYSGKTTTGRDKWDVYFADGTKASAWEYSVAAKAQQAQQAGSVVTAVIEEKANPNGGNPYRNLKDIVGASAILAPAQGVQVAQNGTAGRQNGSQGLTGGSMTPEDKIRVTKLSCISSAAAIFSGSGDVEQTLQAAAQIFNAVMQKPAEQPAPVLAAVPAEPAAVAAFVTEQAGAPVVAVGAVQAGDQLDKPAPLPWAVA